MARKFFPALLLISLIWMSACGSKPPVTATPAEEATPETVATPLPPTPEPASRTLNICLGGEPSTLYPYGDLNSAARSVLSAVYDGPMDVVGYGYEPVILEKIPSIDDGDAQVSEATVSLGDRVVDSDGDVITLAKGDRVRPRGCRSDECAINYDGISTIVMDQLVATFTILDGLMWSDGEPLTADDSIYSFELAKNAVTPTNKYVIERTESYEAADEITTQWWGLPGYIDPEYFTNYWMPLPEHKWGQGQFSAADLLQVDVSAHEPLGWGPYIIQSWNPGESIHLVKNLNYFRVESGLPKFDELNFIFMPDANSAMTALVDGTCDLLDPSVNLDGQVGLLQQMQTDGQAQLITAQSSTMEWLAFDIRHSSYDDGLNFSGLQPDHPDLFGDVRVRKAIALCLDRQKVVDTVLYGYSRMPDSYLPYDHPLHNGVLQAYNFDPASGRDILQSVGWIDHDKNPSTPRHALGVVRVPNGTPLVLNYLTTSATQRRQVVDILSGSLAECGIGLNPVFVTASELYEQGPMGQLFGRTYELGQYAIGTESLEPQCNWFTSDQIPAETNQWVGTNVSGYANKDFDTACKSAQQSLPGEEGYSGYQKTQTLFANDIPSIPLYMRLKVAATRNDFCGFALEPSTLYSLADIENFDYGAGCQ